MTDEEVGFRSPTPAPSSGAEPVGLSDADVGFKQPGPAQPPVPGLAPVSSPATDQAMAGSRSVLGQFNHMTQVLEKRYVPGSIRTIAANMLQGIAGGVKSGTRGVVESLNPPVQERPPGFFPQLSDITPAKTALQARQESEAILKSPWLNWTQQAPEYAKQHWPTPKGYENTWQESVGRSAGTFFPVLASGPLAPATIGFQTAGEIAEHTYNEKIAQGMDPEQAAQEAYDKAQAGGAAATVAWAALPKPIKATLDKFIIDKLGWQKAKRFFLNRGVQAVEGAALGVTTQVPVNIATGEPVMKDVGETAKGLAIAQAIFPRGRTHKEVETAKAARQRQIDAMAELTGEGPLERREGLKSETAAVQPTEEGVGPIIEQKEEVSTDAKQSGDEKVQPGETAQRQQKRADGTFPKPGDSDYVEREAEGTETGREVPSEEKPVGQHTVHETPDGAFNVVSPKGFTVATYPRGDRASADKKAKEMDEVMAEKADESATPYEMRKEQGVLNIYKTGADDTFDPDGSPSAGSFGDTPEGRKMADAAFHDLMTDQGWELADMGMGEAWRPKEVPEPAKPEPAKQPKPQSSTERIAELEAEKAAAAADKTGPAFSLEKDLELERLKKEAAKPLETGRKAAGVAEEKSKWYNLPIDQLLPKPLISRYQQLDDEWGRLNDEGKEATIRGDRDRQQQIAEKQIAIKQEQWDIENRLPDGDILDTLIVGSGVTGNGAAISFASEGQRVKVLESSFYGGGTRGTILENMSGDNPFGVMGAQRALADRNKARRFGAQYEKIVDIRGKPTYDPKTKIWTTRTIGPGPNGEGGKVYRSRAILGATGTRGKGAPFKIVDSSKKIITEAGITGTRGDKSGVKIHLDNAAGVYSESRRKGNGPMIFLGGANSSVQGAILTASKKGVGPIHLIYRGEVPAASAYLRRNLEPLVADGRIILHPNEQIMSVEAPSKDNGMQKVAITEKTTYDKDGNVEKTELIRTPGVSIGSFLGGRPITEWLPHGALRNEKGYVITSNKLEGLASVPTGFAGTPTDVPIPGFYFGGSGREGVVNRFGPSSGEGTTGQSHTAKFLLDQLPQWPKWRQQLWERFNREEYGVPTVKPSVLESEATPEAGGAGAGFWAPASEFAGKKVILGTGKHARETWVSAETGDPAMVGGPPEKVYKHHKQLNLGEAGATLFTQPQGQQQDYPTPKGMFRPGKIARFKKFTDQQLESEMGERKLLKPYTDKEIGEELARRQALVAPRVRQPEQQGVEARAQARPMGEPGMIAEPRPPTVRDRLNTVPETLSTETLRDSVSKARTAVEDFGFPQNRRERQVVNDLVTKTEGWQNIIKERERVLAEDPVRAQAEAERRVAANPHYPEKLVTDLSTGKRGTVDAADELVMLRDRTNLQDKRDAAAKVAMDEKQPMERRSEAGANFEDLDAQIRHRDLATDEGNIFKGRSNRNAWHQFRMRDYDTPTMKQKLQVAKGGTPVTKAEEADIQKKVDAHKRAMDDVEKAKVRTGWRPGLGSKVAPGLRHKQYLAQNAKDALDETIFKEMAKHRGKLAKAVSLYRNVAGVSRGIMTMDMTSALLRQGGLFFRGNPIRSLRITRDVIRAARSDEGYFKLMQDIRERPNAEMYIRSKLALTDIKNPKMEQLEEQYMGQWTDKIPILNNSQRAYVYFLNRLRADVFDTMAHNLGRNGNVTLEQAKGLSNFINVFTGRGHIPEQAAGAVSYANELFFAPRYTISRFQALTLQPLRYAKDPMVRKLIAIEYAKTLIGYAVFYGLVGTALKQLGATVEWNPLSSDFGKIKIGNTRWDPLSGISQATVILARGITGYTKTSEGKIVKMSGPKAFTTRRYFYTLADFVRQKFAPVPAAFVNSMEQQKVTGEKTTALKEGVGLVTPLNGMDVYNAMMQQGVPQGVAAFLIANFGDSVNTYATKVKTRQRKQHRSRTRD
jgi:thioredoxin reductase